METISRSSFPSEMQKILRDCADVRALAKSIADKYRNNGKQLADTLSNIIDEVENVNGYLYSLDGGIYDAGEVQEALVNYINNGEIDLIQSKNLQQVSNDCLTIMHDSKIVNDANLCYANAFEILSNASEDIASISDFNALNTAYGIDYTSLEGYSDIANVICNSEFTIEEKVLTLVSSVSDQSIVAENNSILTVFDRNAYGLGPLAAWFTEFLPKLQAIDWSNIATIIVSGIRAAFNVIKLIRQTFKNFVSYLLHKYVLDGSVFDANMSDSKPTYLTTPVMQFSIPGNLSVVADTGAFVSFSQRGIINSLINFRKIDNDFDFDPKFKYQMACFDVRFMILKFGILVIHYDESDDVLKCVIFLIPSDPSKINEFIAPCKNQVYKDGSYIQNFTPFSYMNITYDQNDGASLQYHNDNSVVKYSEIGNFISFVLFNAPKDTLTLLFRDTNLDYSSKVDDKMLYSGLLFSKYKFIVLLNLIANFDLIQPIYEMTFTPTIYQSGDYVINITYQHLSVEYLNILATYHSSILQFHPSNTDISNSGGAFSDTSISWNNFDNDHFVTQTLYSNIYKSTLDQFSPSTGGFIENIDDITHISTLDNTLTQSILSDFLGTFVVFSTLGQSTITDSLSPMFLPAKNILRNSYATALISIACFLPYQRKYGSGQYFYLDNEKYYKDMFVYPVVAGINRFAKPGISIITNEQQAALFRRILIGAGIVLAISAVGAIIGTAITKFRSKVIQKNLRAESKYLAYTRTVPGTPGHVTSKREALQAADSASRWNGFAQAIGQGNIANTSYNLSGLIKGNDNEDKLNTIINLID